MPDEQRNNPTGYIPGEPKKGLAERIRILKERRLLRKDLRKKGIKKWSDFNAIAEGLGLPLSKAVPLLLWFRRLGSAGLAGLLAASLLMVTVLYLFSTITENKGAFTVNLTGDMLDAGFVLSDTKDFAKETSRLFSERQHDVNNITMTDIAENVDRIDGPHNGKHYVAYTFYIRNKGEAAADYAWYLRMTSEVLSVTDAVWLMVFEDGRQLTYTRPKADGTPEQLAGFPTLPFMDVSYSEDQYFQQDGLFGIKTTPYADGDTVAQGVMRGVVPGESHKYTVVIWIEGYDPQCTDDIFGGSAKFDILFENVTGKADAALFTGPYRTAYQDQ